MTKKLLIAITLVTLIYGPQAEQDQIRPQIAQFVGDKAAALLQGIKKNRKRCNCLSNS